MRTILLLTALAGACSPAELAPPVAEAGADLYGFVGQPIPLDGSQSTGASFRWDTGDGEIVDGVLVGHGGQGYLSSVEDYDNFELVVEARISDTGGGRGNSGVYFRCASHTDKTQEFPIGYEAQLDHGDGNNPTGSIYNLGSEGAKAPRFADLKDDEWVTMRIRVVGDHVQTWVNDKPAADCKLPEKDRLMTGSVLLQMHHKTGKVEFRKVEIRKLKVR